MRRALPVALVGALLLTGCAGDTAGELRRSVADLTDEANDRDADGVRDGVQQLTERLDEAVRANEIDPAEAARLTELARLLGERADLLTPLEDPEPTVTPSPEPTAEPEPEPTEEPEPEPTEEPEPEPTEEPEPEPTEEPEPTQEPEPTAEPTLVPELPGS